MLTPVGFFPSLMHVHKEVQNLHLERQDTVSSSHSRYTLFPGTTMPAHPPPTHQYKCICPQSKQTCPNFPPRPYFSTALLAVGGRDYDRYILSVEEGGPYSSMHEGRKGFVIITFIGGRRVLKFVTTVLHQPTLTTHRRAAEIQRLSIKKSLLLRIAPSPQPRMLVARTYWVYKRAQHSS